MSRMMRTVTTKWKNDAQGVSVDDPENVLDAFLGHEKRGLGFHWSVRYSVGDEGYVLSISDDLGLRERIAARLRRVAKWSDKKLREVSAEDPESVRDFLAALAPMVEAMGDNDTILID